MVDDVRRGTAYGAAAYLLWGLFPLYWPLLEPAGAVEILAHRIVWSLLVVLVIVSVQRKWADVRILTADPRALVVLTVAALLLAGNWCTYIYGVNSEQVVETSLGYFITPIVSVLLGVVLLGERMRPAQWLALSIGSVAVIVLAIDYGRPPLIALTLALSFGVYGLLKKRVGDRVGAVQSLTVETLVLFLPALAWLLWLTTQGQGHFGVEGIDQALLLASSGVVTAIPLLFFAAAARRVPLTVIGLLQYLAPVLQFLTGVVLYDEPMPASRLAGFVLVWAALAVLTADLIVTLRRTRPAVAEEVALSPSA